MKLENYKFTQLYNAWTNISQRQRVTSWGNLFTPVLLDKAERVIKENSEFRDQIDLVSLYDIKDYFPTLAEVYRWRPLANRVFDRFALEDFLIVAQGIEPLYSEALIKVRDDQNNKLLFFTFPGLAGLISELTKIERVRVRARVNREFIREHPILLQSCIENGPESLDIISRIFPEAPDEADKKAGVKIINGICLITLPRFGTATIIKDIKREAMKSLYGKSPEKAFVDSNPELTLIIFESQSTPTGLSRKSITGLLRTRDNDNE